jgi:NADH-quinone oxidoreductase subunit J
MAALLGGTFLFLLLYVAWSVPAWSQSAPPADVSLADSKLTTEIGLALSGVRLDGKSGYMLPFVIVSVHLLVVLIGASYLARTKRRANTSAT